MIKIIELYQHRQLSKSRYF